MLVVRVELWSAITQKKTEIARMIIANDGSGTKEIGIYDASTIRGRSKESLDKAMVSRVYTRSGKVVGHRRLKDHVWSLVEAALRATGYDKTPRGRPDTPPKPPRIMVQPVRVPDPVVPEQKLTKNSAQCLKCEEVLESWHRHDFRRCKCGNLCVDGGLDYVRRLADNFTMVKELCEYESPEPSAPAPKRPARNNGRSGVITCKSPVPKGRAKPRRKSD